MNPRSILSSPAGTSDLPDNPIRRCTEQAGAIRGLHPEDSLERVYERFRLCSSKCPCWSFERDRYIRSRRRDVREAPEGTP
jgi:hypothetical protein